MKTSEVLNKAADLIEERGWGTGPASAMGHGGLCIMGAIHLAHYGSFPEDEADIYVPQNLCPAGHAIFQHLQDRDDFIDRATDVWHWNDVMARHSSEVVEVLRACAVIEASRERESVEAP